MEGRLRQAEAKVEILEDSRLDNSQKRSSKTKIDTLITKY
jgi:hypothetical protein